MDYPQELKDRVRNTIACVEEEDLPDSAHWMKIHDLLNMDYGDVFPIMTSDPEFFGITKVPG